MTPSWLASSVVTTSEVAGLARWVDPVCLPETGAVADCAWSADRPTVSAMSVAMLVFIVFSFYSLPPVARLGHEAVDKAVERSESWGAAEVGGTLSAGLVAGDGRPMELACLDGSRLGFGFG